MTYSAFIRAYSPPRRNRSVARGAMALLTELVRQASDAAAPGEVKDLADALAVLAPLVRAPQVQTEAI